MEVKAGYKQTEPGVIPEDWEVIQLADVFTFKNGLNKEKQFFGKGTPIVNYLDVYKNTGIVESDILGRVTLSPQEIKNYEVKKGDVFFTRTSETIEEIGLSTVVLSNVKDTVFSGFVLRARPKNERLALQYKKYCFSTSQVRKEITSKSSYTTRALTNGRLLSNVKIAIPKSTSEQTAIATALSDTDALINSLDKLIAKKRNIKQGAMQQLLQPKEGWEVRELPEVCWFQEGPGLRNWQFTKSGIKVINVTNLENGLLNLDRTDRHISLDEFNKMYRHFEIEENDIVVASSGNSYGKVAVVRRQDLPLLMNTSVIRFKPLQDLDYAYLLTFLKSTDFKNQIDLLITGGAQPNFGPAHLKKIKIRLPPTRDEQAAISGLISDMDAEIGSLETKLEKYKQIKLGMMQQLLTGKIRLV